MESDSESRANETSDDPLDAGLRAVFEPSEPGLPPPGALEPPELEVPTRLPRILLRSPEEEPEAVVRPGSEEIPAGPPGRYQLHGEIARGGMGVILKGRDQDLGRELAMKVILKSHRRNPELLQRFVEEAQIGGQLQHPGIVPVYELGQLGDRRPYFTMKFVKGQSLGALLDKRQSAAEDRQRFLSIFEQVAQTVAYAHARGVIHRDLKPSNIMVGAFGEALVMDWGLAKVLQEGGVHDERRARKTQGQATVTVVNTVRTVLDGTKSQQGSIFGTPTYMPPEQARGDVEDLDERADVFGLGAILCEILTGKPPYEGHGMAELRRQAVEGRLEEAWRRIDASDADADVRALARKCLAAEARDRPRDAGAVAQVMRSYFDRMGDKMRSAELEAARAKERALGEKRRRRLTAGIAAVVLLTLLAAGGLYLGQEKERERTAAATAAEVERLLVRAVELRGGATGRQAGANLPAWERALRASIDAAELAREDGIHESLRHRAGRVREEITRGKALAEEASRSAERDRRMSERLDRLRLELEESDATGLWKARCEEAFAAYFKELESTWDLSRAETMAAAMRQRAIALDLARGLDDWAMFLARETREKKGGAAVPKSGAEEEESWKKILRLASATDLDPWRVRIRSAIEKESLRELEEAARALPERLYHDQPGAHTAREGERSGPPGEEVAPAATYSLLGSGLALLGDWEGAAEMLEQGLVYHPGDFWLQHDLGALLFQSLPEDPVQDVPPSGAEECVARFQAALALRRGLAHAWIDLGAALHRAGEPEEASSCLREALRLEPSSHRAWLRLAEALHVVPDLEGEITACRQALQLAPETDEARSLLAEALSRKGDHDGAIALYREIIARGPQAPSQHLRLGECLLARSRAEEAAAALRQAAELAPGDGVILQRLGEAALSALSLEEAQRTLEKAAELLPRDGRVRRQLGIARGRRGDLEGAVAALKEAAALDPELVTVKAPGSPRQVAFTEMEAVAEECRSAAALLEMALEADLQEPHVPLLKACFDLRLGKLEEAIPALRKALASDPGSARALELLGLALHRQGKHAEAIEAFTGALNLEGKSYAALNNRGAALHASGRTEEAKGDFQAAAQSDAKRPAAHLHLGIILAEEGRLAFAEGAFARAVAADGRSAEALYRLGKVLFDRERFTAALPRLRRAIALDPRHASAAAILGAALSMVGLPEEARSWFKRALEMDPTNALAHYRLGHFLGMEGDVEGSFQHLERASQLDPGVAFLVKRAIGFGHQRRKDQEKALLAFKEALSLNPADSPSLATAISILEDSSLDVGDAPVALAKTLEAILDSGQNRNPQVSEAFILASLRSPQDTPLSRALELARRAQEAPAGREVRSAILLARLLRAAGRLGEAIHTLEDAVHLSAAPQAAASLLEELQCGALPDLPTYGSADAALERREEILAGGASWRFFPGREDPSQGLEWAQRGFDDSLWKEGAGGFGFLSGGMEGGTLLEDMPGAYTTLYLRRSFRLDLPERLLKLFLSVKASDGFIAYLNGTEVARVRAGKPGERLTFRAEAESATSEPFAETIVEVPGVLVASGENLLAIQGLNAKLDDHLGFYLKAVLLGEPAPAEDRRRLAASLEATEAPSAPVRAYLEGRILERAGEPAAAAERFRAVLALDRSRHEPFLRLKESLRKAHGRTEGYRLFAAEAAKGDIPRSLLDFSRDPPEPVQPAAGTIVEGPTVILEIASIPAIDKSLDAPRTRWQVRAAREDYERRPALEVVTAEGVTSLRLSRGQMLPGVEYFWRASHILSDGTETTPSAEVSFRTGSFKFEPVRIDLAGVFNRDVVANPGDPDEGELYTGSATWEALRVSERPLLPLDGYDGSASDNPRVRGMPRDRLVGVHLLGDYGGLNSLQLSGKDRTPVRIEVPRGRYAAVRFLLSSSPGRSALPVKFEYASGRDEVRRIPCRNIIDSLLEVEESPQDARAFRVLKGLDLLRNGRLDDCGSCGLYEVPIELPAGEELTAITLLPAQARFEKEATRLNLFAITCMKVLEE